MRFQRRYRYPQRRRSVTACLGCVGVVADIIKSLRHEQSAGGHARLLIRSETAVPLTWGSSIVLNDRIDLATTFARES
jgi:hypothetical protein